MKRREFLATTLASVAGGLLITAGCLQSATPAKPERSSTNSPGADTPETFAKYKGFNLLEKFPGDTNPRYREADFAMMAEWGFNFARLPMSYWTWGSVKDWRKIDEGTLRHIDEAVAYGQQYGIHVNLNFHRAPGYCINNGEAEPFQLFKDPQAVEATCYHWAHFAERYRGIPNSQLSFDLLNEPPTIPEEQHNPVMRAIIAAIREKDPQRLIVVDGLNVGRKPILGLADAGVVQSARGYDPIEISHYRAPWMREWGAFDVPEPTWPLVKKDGTVVDSAKLKDILITPWQPVVDKGVTVHVGEWGCYNQTPHGPSLAYMEAMLQLWKEANWGWALWNLRGEFGPLDSHRADVKYERYRGHQLDRAMLELLQRYA